MCYHDAPSPEEFSRLVPKTPGVMQNYSFKINEIPFKVTVGTSRPGQHLLIFDWAQSPVGEPRLAHTIDSLKSVEEVCGVWKEFLKNPRTFLPVSSPSEDSPDR